MSIITNIDKYVSKGINVLTPEEIKEVCPSAYAETFSLMRTDKYSMFGTGEIIEALSKEGFVPTMAYQHNPKHSARYIEARKERIERERLHQRHLIRFTHIDHIGGNLKDERPELVLVNSHNGACSYQLSAGIFRLICSNGLVVKSEDFGSVNIRHEGHSLEEVVAASLNIVNHFNEIYPIIDQMKHIKLKASELPLFARQAAKVKYGEKKFENIQSIIDPCREEDAENTLWNVFNRAQENIMRGGKKVTTRIMRPIERIDEGIRVNTELWNLANNWRSKRLDQIAA